MKSFDLYDLLNNTSTTIVQARQARDMSQRDLADEANISYPHMADIENDKVDMNIFKSIHNVNLATIIGYRERDGGDVHLFTEHYDES